MDVSDVTTVTEGGWPRMKDGTTNTVEMMFLIKVAPGNALCTAASASTRRRRRRQAAASFLDKSVTEAIISDPAV